MARTATGTKATKARKPSQNTGSPAAGDTVDIRMIPLSKLKLSPQNVRRVPPSDTEEAELLASVRAEGVKQNLVVHPGPKGSFLVDAGGRRLKALQALADAGDIKTDHPVACLVEDAAKATISSTIENTQRVAVHPADQFEAFATLIEEGRTEDEIATKFGVSVALVRRRLKLARVAPEILEAFRAGDLTLECVMAFTLTDHHDRQITVWSAIKDGNAHYPHHIKRLLTESSYSASSKLARFVGIEAYEAAGGTVMSDLFSDFDTTYFERPDLVERLALEKLQDAAEAYTADWKWVDIHLELEHGALRSFGRVRPLEAEPDPALVKELEELHAREEELATNSDQGDFTDEEWEEYEAIEVRVSEIQSLINAARPYAEEDRAIAGVVLTVDRDGSLRIEKGLVKPEDIPQPNPENITHAEVGSRVTSQTSSQPVPVADPAAVLRRADGITAGLADDLRTTRHHILQAHLAADYDVAFDILLYTLCEEAFSYGYRNEALDMSLRRTFAPNAEKLVAGSVVANMLGALKTDLRLEWMKLDKPDDFRALSALPAEDKQALFA